MDNGNKSATAFLLGLIAGGVLGILFAPKSGKETRDDIQNYLNEAEKKLEEKKIEIKEATAKHMATIKDQVSKTFQQEKERITAKSEEESTDSGKKTKA